MSTDGPPGTTPSLKRVLSIVTPSLFLKIHPFYGGYDFPGVESWRSDWPQLSKVETGGNIVSLGRLSGRSSGWHREA